MKEPLPGGRPFAAVVKTALSWSIAVAFCAAECIFHWRCGFGDGPGKSSLVHGASSCTHAAAWASIPDFTEGVCRCGVALALAGLCWETARAAQQGEACDYLRWVFVGDGGASVYAGVVLGGFTMAMGFWGIAADGVGLPLWADVYLHTFEALCAMTVVACLAGLLCDFLLSGSLVNAMRLLRNLALCADSLDDHAHWSGTEGACHRRRPETADPEPRADRWRAAFVWIVFILTLGCVVFNWASDRRHACIAVPLDVFGIFCISGIAFAIVTGAAELGVAVVSTMGERSIASVVPPFRPAERAEPSETEALMAP